MKVFEFRNVHDLNDYLGQVQNYVQNKLTIIPLSKTFENPSNKMLVNTITYVVIEAD